MTCTTEQNKRQDEIIITIKFLTTYRYIRG